MSTAGGVRFSVGGHTDVGRRAEIENEDHLVIDSDLGLFLVSDSSGRWEGEAGRAGQYGGEVVQRAIRQRLPLGEEPRLLIEQALRAARDAIRAEPLGGERSGGASIVLAFLCGGAVHVSWIGDATAYHISGADIRVITWPHTLREVMLRQGTLTEAADQQHGGRFSRVLIHCLGLGELPDPLEVVSFAPAPGDRLILTTDGVHDNLPPSQLLAACRSHPEPQACAEHVVAAALEYGSRDNCTCVVVAFDRTGDGPPPEPPKPSRPWWRFW